MAQPWGMNSSASLTPQAAAKATNKRQPKPEVQNADPRANFDPEVARSSGEAAQNMKQEKRRRQRNDRRARERASASASNSAEDATVAATPGGSGSATPMQLEQAEPQSEVAAAGKAHLANPPGQAGDRETVADPASPGAAIVERSPVLDRPEQQKSAVPQAAAAAREVPLADPPGPAENRETVADPASPGAAIVERSPASSPVDEPEDESPDGRTLNCANSRVCGAVGLRRSEFLISLPQDDNWLSVDWQGAIWGLCFA